MLAAQRANRDHLLGTQAQANLTGGDHSQAAPEAHHAVEKRGDVVNDVLAVVEHEQRIELRYRPDGQLGPVVVEHDRHRPRDRGQDMLARVQRRQLDEVHTGHVLAGTALRYRARQRRLAHPARPRERHHRRDSQQLEQRGALLVAADEPVGRGRATR